MKENSTCEEAGGPGDDIAEEILSAGVGDRVPEVLYVPSLSANEYTERDFPFTEIAEENKASYEVQNNQQKRNIIFMNIK